MTAGASRRACARALGPRSPSGAAGLAYLVRAAVLAVGVLAVAPGRCLAQRGGAAPLAFVDVAVWTAADSVPRPHHTVLVRGGVIERIGPLDSIDVPPDARRIPVPAGAILIPGLVDAHVHLEAQPERWMGLFVAHGVTTVFNLRGTPDHLALRARVESGDVTGPHILTAGSYANIPMVQSPDDADSLVRAQRAAGYDFVKIHGNLSARTYAALQAASLREGIPIVGHAPRNLPFDSVLTAEAHRNVAHAEELLYTHFATARDSARVADVVTRMAARRIWLTPTLAVYHAIATQVGRPAVIDSALASAPFALPSGIETVWRAGMYTGRNLATAPGYARNARFLDTLTFAAWRAGVPLLVGTDTPLPLMWPGSSLIDELDALVRAGLPRHAVLRAATVNAGRFARQFVARGPLFGVLMPGARADLVLVGADPFESFAALRRPLGVAVGGRWYDRAALDSLLTHGAASGEHSRQ